MSAIGDALIYLSHIGFAALCGYAIDLGRYDLAAGIALFALLGGMKRGGQ